MERTTPRKIVTAELRHLEQAIAALEAGQLTPELFRKIRLQLGIYSIRDDTHHYMVRIGLPVGRITADQLAGLARLLETFALRPMVHLTTRQDFQVYGVGRHHLVDFLSKLAELGLSTRETSGNVVRNVVCCPHAGAAPDETFDVAPYALAVRHYFLRNPLTQGLPRKVKISFEGCVSDHVRTSIHDIGVVAVWHQDKMGCPARVRPIRAFQIYVGGGLGSTPRSARLLEPWTSEQQLVPTLEAILRVFDRYGERHQPSRARLKFLVEQMGKEFTERVLELRESLWAIQSGIALGAGGKNWIKEVPPKVGKNPRPVLFADPQAFARWCELRIYRQRQPGFFGVSVPVSLGDLSIAQLKGLARLVRRTAGGVGLTSDQELLLRFVPERVLATVYKGLRRLGLAGEGRANNLRIARCPGADSCLTAITYPRGLALALEGRLKTEDLASLVDPLSIKISGCPNACSQHPIADIGLFGVALKAGERFLPGYQILVGGGTQPGGAEFGQRLAKVPSRRTPEAVNRLLQMYVQQRCPDETYPSFVKRIGCELLRRSLEDLIDLTPVADAPDLCKDFGTDETFVLKTRRGECAA